MKLNEWKDSKGNKVSTGKTSVNTSSASNNPYSGSGYKKRFDKLINYYSKHLPKGVDYIHVALLTKDTLVFTEYYRTGSTSKITVYIGAATEAWNLKCEVDGKLTDDISGSGWTDLLKLLNKFITLPVVGTPEYKDLLVEWVDSKGKKININNTSSQTTSNKASSNNTIDQEYRYRRLLAQIDADGIAKYKLNELTDTTLDITVDTKYKSDYDIHIEYLPAVNKYLFFAGRSKTTIEWDYEEILDILTTAAVIKDTDLCESLTESLSFADEFRLYENLF